MLINSDFIEPNAIVIDIHTRPQTTELLRKAQQLGCQIIYGYKMFIEQALGQFSILVEDRIETDLARKISKK
jgi:3-dehydroquinate dehydratase/shikimate dehydrogenase